MPKEDTKILKYNHDEKSVKVPFVIYADLESLLEQTRAFSNNPEKSSTIKLNGHTPWGDSLFTHCIQFNNSMILQVIVIKVKTVWKGFVRT